MSLICGAYFVGSAWLGKDSYRLSPGLVLNTTEQYSASVKCEVSSVSPALDVEVNDVRENTQVEKCNDKCRPVGSESLPRGIVSTTSNLEMQRLSGPISEDTTAELSSQSSSPRNLSDSGPSASSELHNPNSRYNIRLRSYAEMRVFRNRWNKAVKEDECWVDPFEQPAAPQNTR
ncbi:UNVERIFIED_CONTAM: hypothetical protein Scaly_1408900 [Sesamum calycinum]|uniref:Uncharacterized protein n=1 Tax=Sesamum calycinum TaxID=2727403 RepID=A0AAW2PN09_9LAMI